MSHDQKLISEASVDIAERVQKQRLILAPSSGQILEFRVRLTRRDVFAIRSRVLVQINPRECRRVFLYESKTSASRWRLSEAKRREDQTLIDCSETLLLNNFICKPVNGSAVLDYAV